jgi:hypothetical protein
MERERQEARIDQGYQAIWGVGQLRSEQNAPGQRRARDHRKQQHIIGYDTGRAGQRGTRTRTGRGRGGRQSSYRATEPGERERKGNGLHARSPLRGTRSLCGEALLTLQAWGWALAARDWAWRCRIARCCQSSAGPLLLVYTIQRITPCSQEPSGGASEALRAAAAFFLQLTWPDV